MDKLFLMPAANKEAVLCYKSGSAVINKTDFSVRSMDVFLQPYLTPVWKALWGFQCAPLFIT